jgi:hypothetical protein
MTRWLAAAAIAVAAVLCGCSHPSLVEQQCARGAQAYALSHFSAPGCVSCTDGGGTYMWFWDPGRWECNG